MVMGEFSQETDLLVVGGGPGGYAAAFRAADLGLDVTMVDMDPRPGGVCLFRGCIPSKTLLYVTELMHDAQRAQEMGITFGKPKIEIDRLRDWKNHVVDKLANGLVELTKRRGVLYIQAGQCSKIPPRKDPGAGTPMSGFQARDHRNGLLDPKRPESSSNRRARD